MSRLTNLIEEFIKEMLEEKSGILEFQRNELANIFKCTPSQINYVLETRFTVERGYYIESRKGGGGYIRVVKLDTSPDDYLKNIIKDGIGEKISQNDAFLIIKNLREKDIIEDREAYIMRSILNDKFLNVEQELRDRIRANILKAILSALLLYKKEKEVY